ncbi:MAG: hypothetical protein ACP5NB_11400, partial [Chloroflexia bacterium]
MKRTRSWLLVLVAALVVALTSVGVTLAGPPAPSTPPPPAPPRQPSGPGLQGNFNQPADTSVESGIQATPMGLMSYQGKLLQNGSPYNGNIDITFRLYKQATGGTAFWEETQTVSVSDGLFNVMLGAVNPMADAQEFYEQVWLGIQPAGASSELTPRQPLGAVGYANNLLPGATMVDPGLSGYWASFYVWTTDHPAIYGGSATDVGVIGETHYTDTSAIEGYSYGPGGQGVYGYAGHNGTGVHGYGEGDGGWAGGTGVYGEGTNGLFSAGVFGRGGTWGVFGTGDLGVAGSGDVYGVFGSTTATDTVGVYGTTSGADKAHGVYGEDTGDAGACSAADTDCGSGVYGTASGDAYASFFYGENRCAVLAKNADITYYTIFARTLGAPNGAGIWTDGESRFEDYVTFAGGKSGYVVDIARNGGTEVLERGDVVVISGYDAPVVGNVPVIVVSKATEANATGVVGVVDVLYEPCDKPQEELRDGQACGGFREDVTTVQPGQYLAVVTLGAYGYLKVDASGGPIRPGDLLSASPMAGYAARAPLLTVEGVSFHAPGTIIGKALGS